MYRILSNRAVTSCIKVTALFLFRKRSTLRSYFFGKAQTALAVSADAAVWMLFSDRDKALFCQHRILLRAAVTEQSPAHAQIIGSRQIQFSGDDAFAAAVGFCDQLAAGIRDKG